MLLYGEEHPNGKEIGKLATKDESKVDCLIIMGTSLKIPGIKSLIKKFSRAARSRGGYIILVNKTDVITKEWNGVIDYQIEGACDDWVRMVEEELEMMEKQDEGESERRKIRRGREGRKIESC